MPWSRNSGIKVRKRGFDIDLNCTFLNAGHEIAVHSISHRGPEEWWGTNATIEDWFDEMVGQANIINRSVAVILISKKYLVTDLEGWTCKILGD